MKTACRFLASLVMLCVLAILAVAADYVKVINVKDAPYNAAGDGVADDSAALQAAFDDACSGANRTYRVYLPAGEYRITTALYLEYNKNNNGINYKDLLIEGAGRESSSPYPNSLANNAPTIISWDGADGGTMLTIKGAVGPRIKDLVMRGNYLHDGVSDVNGRAGKIILVQYALGFPTGQLEMQRVALFDATTGIETDPTPGDLCNSDMTFDQLKINNCDICFHLNGNQAVDYVFSRMEMGNCNVAMWLERGGQVVVNGCFISNADVGIKIDNPVGCYTFNNCKVDQPYYDAHARRITFLEAHGASNVNISGLCVNSGGVENDKIHPLFQLYDTASVTVDDSELNSYYYADCKYCSFVQFDNCRFRYGDPRMDTAITHESRGGFELRNARINNGLVPSYRDSACWLTPKPPTNLTADTITQTSVNLHWVDNSDNEEGFTIGRSTNGVSFTSIANPAANATSATISNLSPNTKYYFRIISYLGGAGSMYSNVVEVTTSP